ncbi:MAG: hypothetical protein NUW37_03245 [Planctomycetes bacterium]|nr:hypothetical protein [Planctomycetota bacterium]
MKARPKTIPFALLAFCALFAALFASRVLVAEESAGSAAREREEIALFLEALDLYESDISAATEKFDELLDRFNSNGSRSPYHEGALYYCALCHKNLGETEKAIELVSAQLTLYPEAARSKEAKALYLELTGADFEVGFALSTVTGCFSSFVSFVRVRDFERAYDCCSQKFKRNIPLDVFARALEISRSELLRAEVVEFAGDDQSGALTLRRGPGPAEQSIFALPMTRADSRWLIDLGY